MYSVILVPFSIHVATFWCRWMLFKELQCLQHPDKNKLQWDSLEVINAWICLPASLWDRTLEILQKLKKAVLKKAHISAYWDIKNYSKKPHSVNGDQGNAIQSIPLGWLTGVCCLASWMDEREGVISMAEVCCVFCGVTWRRHVLCK